MLGDYVEGHRFMSLVEGGGGFGIENTLTARCTCGWHSHGNANRDEAIESLMKHSYEVGWAAKAADVDEN